MRLYQQHHNDISLVLSDKIIKKMSGLQLYKTLSERYPNVKMVIMTGYPLENDGKALLEQGILKWLFKPFSSEQLYDAIKESLKINP